MEFEFASCYLSPAVLLCKACAASKPGTTDKRVTRVTRTTKTKTTPYDPPFSQGSSFAEDQVPQFGFECFHGGGLGDIQEIPDEMIVISADL